MVLKQLLGANDLGNGPTIAGILMEMPNTRECEQEGGGWRG